MSHTRFDDLFSKIHGDPQFRAITDASSLIFCFEQKPGKSEGVVYAYPVSKNTQKIKPISELFDNRIWFVIDKLNASSPTGLDALATYHDDERQQIDVDMSRLVAAWYINDVPKIIGFN